MSAMVDCSTPKLKRHYFKWVKASWKWIEYARKYGDYMFTEGPAGYAKASKQVLTAKGRAADAKRELDRRGVWIP